MESNGKIIASQDRVFSFVARLFPFTIIASIPENKNKAFDGFLWLLPFGTHTQARTATYTYTETEKIAHWLAIAGKAKRISCWIYISVFQSLCFRLFPQFR